MLTHLVTASTLDSTLPINFNKWSRSDLSMNEKAHGIDGNPKLVEPTMMRGLDRAVEVARGDRLPNPHNCRRTMSSTQRTMLDFESDSSDEERKAGRLCLRMETKKGRSCRSGRRNNPMDIDRKPRKNKHESLNCRTTAFESCQIDPQQMQAVARKKSKTVAD